jgi:hypothetical protein
MQAAVAPKAVEKTTHTAITIVFKGLKYVITQPDGELMRLGIYRTRPAKAGGGAKESFLVIKNTQEVYTILYTLLWRGVLPETLEMMEAQMSITGIDSVEPAKFICGEVAVELSFTVIESGDGRCNHGRAHKYSVYTRQGRYASGYNTETTSAIPREINLHDVPAIYLILSTSDNLPERAIIP